MSQDKLRERLVEVARRRRAREADNVGPPGSPELDAQTPLDAEARDRIRARVMKEIGPPPAGQVIPFPLRRRLGTAAAVVAAMAAVVLLFVWPGSRPGMPAYEATFSGESMVRGSEPSGPPRVGPGSSLTLVA